MTKREKILEVLSEQGVLRARDLADYGIAPEYLNALEEEGVIQRLARGVYASAEFAATEHFDLVIVQQRVPHGVFCVLTALVFHDMTTQIPSQIHLAVERGKRSPELDWPPINVFHVSPSQFEPGIEEHQLDAGPTLRVYSPARTVADCFKFRNRIGLDVAIEALRAYWERKDRSVNEIMKYAKVCRVKNVIRPYVEALA